MFTGIIEAVGTVQQVMRGRDSVVVTLSRPEMFDDLHLGDSVAVNGVCLTVTTFDASSFSADVMPETLARSSLGTLRQGSRVNLERAMPALGRFGGHFVSGHIDGTGKIMRIERDDNAIWYTVQAASDLLRYVILKGSIALEGISLTVARVSKDTFSVSIIPYTASETTLSLKRVGDVVNIETDLVGKYVENFLINPGSGSDSGSFSDGRRDAQSNAPGKSTITPEFLLKNGF